jgi:hypothetical protein
MSKEHLNKNGVAESYADVISGLLGTLVPEPTFGLFLEYYKILKNSQKEEIDGSGQKQTQIDLLNGDILHPQSDDSNSSGNFRFRSVFTTVKGANNSSTMRNGLGKAK